VKTLLPQSSSFCRISKTPTQEAE